jgi:hypothetical protein
VRFEGFHLTYRNRDAAQNGSAYGANLEYSFDSLGTVGLTYLRGYRSDIPNLDGLDVYDARVALTPLSFLSKLLISGEYVFEDNGSVARSNGGNKTWFHAMVYAVWTL